MNRFVLRTVVVGAAVLFAPAFVTAQTSPNQGTPQEQRACNSDTRRHCREAMSQGDMAVLACLQQQRAKLSRNCQAVLRSTVSREGGLACTRF